MNAIRCCGMVAAAALGGVVGQGAGGCTDSWAQNYDPSARAEDGSCTYTCPSLLQYADQAWLGGATCYSHSGGAWPSTLASMVINVPVGKNATLYVSDKAIIQGIPSHNSVDPTSRTLLPYRLQVGASGGSAGGTGALALRHVNLEPPNDGLAITNGGGLEVTAGSYAMLMSVTFDSGQVTAFYGGAVYGGSATIIASGCYFGRRIRGSHTGAILVESKDDVPSTLTVIESHFNGSEAFSDGAGCITATGSALEIRSSSFTNCGAPIHNGKALEIQDSTSVQIVDTTFSPQDAVNDVINAPLDNNVLGLLTTGCAQFPCAAGNACSMRGYSLHCTPCHKTAYSPDGESCQQCPAGTQPNSDSSACEGCPAHEYSVSGDCMPCENNTIPSQTQTACTGAYRCDPGHECLKLTCYSAVDCTPCQVGKTSADGGRCTQCGTLAGREIDSPMVHNADNSLCTKCDPGKGPNAARDGCDNCTGIMYSTYGVCQNCIAGTYPAKDYTTCEPPFRCERGHYCPSAVGCGDKDCALCPPGRWNVDGGGSRALDERCKECATDGEAVTPDSDACTTCADGTAPKADHSICIPCLGTNFSSLGAQCKPCESPQVVGAMNQENTNRLPGPRHSLCQKCPAGKGPAGCTEDENGIETCTLGCAECTGNTHSNGNQFAQCQTCPIGKINTVDHHDCSSCKPHQDYVDGVSNVTGECSCGKSGGIRGTGYYNTTIYGLIVCFMDGYHEVDLHNAIELWKQDESMQICQECPPCANCTTGSPMLHNGFISQYQIAEWEEANEPGKAEATFELELQHLDESITHGHQFTFAFFCDSENAVGVNQTATFGYATSELANSRCRSRPLPCPHNLERCASNPVPVSGTCPEGYEGFFCGSCITSTKPPYHAARDKTCQPCNDQYGRYGRIAFGCLGMLGMFIAATRCCKKRRARLKRRKAAKREHEMRDVGAKEDGSSLAGLEKTDGTPAATTQGCCATSEDDAMDDEDEDDKKACCCGCCNKERMDTLKDIYRSGKIPIRTVVTYLQVTAQLSKVYHTQYPPMVQGVLNFLTPLHDFFSILFSAECTTVAGRNFGGFQMKWILRVLGFPMILLILSVTEFLVVWITARVTLDPRWAGQRAEDWANRNGKLTGRSAARATLLQRQLLLIFLAYPQVVNICFSALDCRAVSPSVYVLADDDRIVCPAGSLLDSLGANLQTMSLLVLIVVGFCVPAGFGFLIWSKSKNAAVEDEDVDRVASVILSSRTLPSPPEDDAPSEIARTVTTRRELDATIRQLRALGSFKFLTDAYNPRLPFWETIDLLRKFCLVGLVVLAGRGSSAQIAAGNALSFGFFAAHMKFWPMKTDPDNYLRTSCEIHVIFTITVAFVLKGDLSHEIVQREFYDWLLIVSGIICVPVSSLVCVTWKMRSLARMKREQDGDDVSKAYARFSKGITSDDDQRALRSMLASAAHESGSTTDPAISRSASPPRPERSNVGTGGLHEGLLG